MLIYIITDLKNFLFFIADYAKQQESGSSTQQHELAFETDEMEIGEGLANAPSRKKGKKRKLSTSNEESSSSSDVPEENLSPYNQSTDTEDSSGRYMISVFTIIFFLFNNSKNLTLFY